MSTEKSESHMSSSSSKRLHQAIASLGSAERVAAFLGEVMTPAEASDLELRWALMERLLAGQTQRGIARDLGISLCKITRGAKILKIPDGVARGILQSQLLNRTTY